MPRILDDVIVNFCCIHGVDFTSGDLLLEVPKKSGALVRARQKEVRSPKPPARFLDQVLDELRRIGIHKGGRRVPGRQGGKQTPIAIDFAGTIGVRRLALFQIRWAVTGLAH